jgi:hypothetical protein
MNISQSISSSGETIGEASVSAISYRMKHMAHVKMKYSWLNSNRQHIAGSGTFIRILYFVCIFTRFINWNIRQGIFCVSISWSLLEL